MNRRGLISAVIICFLTISGFLTGIFMSKGSALSSFSGNNPATGDFFGDNIFILIAVLGVAILAMIIIIIMRNNKK